MSTQTTLFPSLGIENAPQQSRPLLEKLQKAYGFVPNLYGAFANSPVLLDGFLALEAAFEKSSLTPKERHIVLLAASVENVCGYCTAAHSTVLKGFLHVPEDIVSAIRSNRPVPDQKLNALVELTKEIVRERGQVRKSTIERFIAAGYSNEQLLEVMLGIAMKTISNYVDHISPTELDPAFIAER